MSEHRVAERYVKSLIELAVEQGMLEQVLTDMEMLRDCLQSADFRLLLRSPIINHLRKREILGKIFRGHLSDLTFTFIGILAAKGRAINLPEMIEAFEHAYKEKMGISTVHLTTASPLTRKTLDAIRQALLQSHDTRDSIDLQTEVDPDLISGFVIDFDYKLYDASVRHQLDELRRAFSREHRV